MNHFDPKHSQVKTPAPWYVPRTSNHQASICDESTGRTVAVVYDKADAPILSAATMMLESLEHVQGHWDAAREEGDNVYAFDLATCPTCKKLVRDAIAMATDK
jgi:hypothetical protein